MEDIAPNKKNFFYFVFNFDSGSKAEMLNIIQYSVLALIPIILLNKSLQQYVPEADDKKGSLELSVEVVLQTIIMFLGLYFIHRIVVYLPTYSGVDYPEFYIHFSILAILMITLSLQTKIGEKVTILTDRIYELWNGKSADKNKKNKKDAAGKNNSMILRQPVSTGISSQGPIDQTSSIGNLPNTADMAMAEQMPNYNNMYQQNTTPLVNAASPDMYTEPMAANALLGGNGFGTW